jgi:uncharacterized protein with ParB-like and HNH nuclease domain
MTNEVIKTDAHSRSVSELLKEKKYQIDYYQREYRWQVKHIEELITDLTEKFLNYYDEKHDRVKDGPKYGHYFLGPIILSHRNGDMFVVDGQQRLTTLTLLLIFLKNLQEEKKTAKPTNLEDYIFSQVRGMKSFNIQVDDRLAVMDALYANKAFDATEKSESVQNISARYQDIQTLFPDELETEHALVMFIDWLLYNVDLVEIVAYSDEDAYTVFETMNDRGLNLNPTDMLKGYLLSNIVGDKQKEQANTLWKKRILDLVELSKKLDVKNEEIEACKTWIRAKYAVTIRERKRGSTNQDFEQIGSAFHRWVKDNSEGLGLKESEDFFRFIHDNFEKYTRYYIKMREKSAKLDYTFEHLYYNNFNNFTLQYILALAPVRLEDDEHAAFQKIRAVTMFVDMYIARRMVNYRTLSYSSIVYSMFNILKEIRDLNLPVLTRKLKKQINEMEETFGAIRDFRLHGANKRQVRYLLARITSYIEQETGVESNFTAYINRSEQKRAKRFEVEHIWADKFEYHKDEFKNKSEDDFKRQRNQLGGLILIPRGINQSYGSLPYEDKLPHYIKENILAKSLGAKCYQRNPNFTNFVAQNGLPFKPHEHFTIKDMKGRQELYIKLAEMIWNPDLLDTIGQE